MVVFNFYFFFNCLVRNELLIEQFFFQIQAIVLELMEDVQPEVRMGAAKVLNGLLHCQFIPEPMELLVSNVQLLPMNLKFIYFFKELFKGKANTKLKHKNQIRNKEDGIVNNNNNIRTRHAGVLGLCAFINSHPYDVPDFLPDVFGQLRPHLSDPQPIPVSILFSYIFLRYDEYK